MSVNKNIAQVIKRVKEETFVCDRNVRCAWCCQVNAGEPLI